MLNIYGCHPRDQAIQQFLPADIMFKELTIIGTLLNPFSMAEAISLIHDMARDQNSKSVHYDAFMTSCIICRYYI
jgi:hypothetical protein